MDNIAKLPQNSRKELFLETANFKKMTAAIAEKDFWTCWVLDKLFSAPDIKEKIIFKGGTSLSKIFRLIERFSEDIDLILNWNLVTDTPPHDGDSRLSKTQQDKFNKKMVESSRLYLKDEFLSTAEKAFCGVVEAEINDDEADVIKVSYPNAFDDSYIRPEIKLEIGVLASWVPHSTYTIQSYAAEIFPEKFSRPSTIVTAIKAERTFWEKVTILHAEANRAQDKPEHIRYSRHYYDLYCMAKSEHIDDYAKTWDILGSVVEFKKTYYPVTWANYEDAVRGSLKLVPPERAMQQLEKDFSKMRSMIFGEVPNFDDIMKTITELQLKING